MKIFAIIGFGFCGRLAFYHLTKKSAQNTKVIIFDKSAVSGLGPAFSSFSPHYILNVPAEKMSAFSDKPQDFCQFLEKKHPQIWQEIGAKGFAPRKIYGEYLDALTKAALIEAKNNNVEVEFVEEDVAEIADIDQDFILKTISKKSYKATEVLLATSFSQSELPYQFANKKFIKKLWDQDVLNFHQGEFSNDEKICLIGSGLTAVDVIAGLKKKNFGGKIFAISRRGNFPQKHFAENPIKSPFIFVDDAKKGVVFLCLKFRKFLAANPDCDLRHAIDSIRPITKELWKNLDTKNRKLFLRFLPYWNIFRHRAPTASIEIIDEMIATKQLEIKKCGVKKIEEKNFKFEVETKDDKMLCDYIVNCLGFEFSAEKYPLLNQMLSANLLKKDLFLASSNNPKIHLLGGLNISRDFECTAVPDLRVSVEDLLINNKKAKYRQQKMAFLDSLQPDDFRNGGSFNQAEIIIDELNKALRRAVISQENSQDFIAKAVKNLFREKSPAAERLIELLNNYLDT